MSDKIIFAIGIFVIVGFVSMTVATFFNPPLSTIIIVGSMGLTIGIVRTVIIRSNGGLYTLSANTKMVKSCMACGKKTKERECLRCGGHAFRMD